MMSTWTLDILLAQRQSKMYHLTRHSLNFLIMLLLKKSYSPSEFSDEIPRSSVKYLMTYSSLTMYLLFSSLAMYLHSSKSY